jgi:Fe-S cluster assembly protein SufD
MSGSEHNSPAARWVDAMFALTPAASPQWLHSLRQAAAGEFRSSGLPHRKVEAWKYTPLNALDEFDLDTAEGQERPPADLPPPLHPDAPLVDIIDGRPVSNLPELPSGVSVLPLAAGIERFEDRLRPLFEGVELDGPARAFTALNTACAQQGLVVHVAGGVDAGALALRWGFSSAGKTTLHHARLVLLIEPGAKLSLVEQYQSTAASSGAMNVLNQVELGAGAQFDHVRLQLESEQSILLGSTRVRQAADSTFRYYGFDLGARLARHDISAQLREPGANVVLSGAFVLDGRRYADNHLDIEHVAPGCRSEQFFRGVLGGRSRGVFNGRALIRAGADGSSVRQSNANLLLSPLAEMDTKPELEIYADEVEASHGATVGQLDETAIFYLRSRGLSEAAARRLLTAAFCRAVSDRLEDRELAGRIAELLDGAMPGEEA